MSYWAEVKDVFFKGVDLATEGIKEGASTIITKGKEGVRYAQLKKDLFLEQRKLHNTLADIGDVVCGIYKERKDLYADDVVEKLIETAGKIEGECRNIENEINSIGVARKAG
jgi:hypothetical protein